VRSELVAPATTAVLTMELQRGVCGDLAAIAVLADAVRDLGVAVAAGRLCRAARAAGATVVHATFAMDPDGPEPNTPMIAQLARLPDYLRPGSAATALITELGPEAGDLVSERHHGLSPFGRTALDDLLRGRGITTVVICGVSLNIGIPGAVIEAVNHGYRVVVAADAVAGVPAEYSADVVRHTLRPLAPLATVAEIVAAWTGA
jgi:nicotinamidase-related amidase